ncbi:trypsin-like peptidase domain-containing protein [Flavicella sp.]|uniref:S1C family serine protease n=1 Tax=Flavicella sp. TaxID=2957742 RepID=UPI00260E1C80|nr:trypsin-like peptidase domain-containing protein [Flavicella sp.]MDG1804958.1 trypsin-like peptidase domain-containing protein [Flavicella sp.]
MKKIVFLLALVSLNISAQDLSKLYKKVSSSVVYINIESYDYSDVLFSQQVRKEESLGSGVLIAEEGLIWTAAHVIQASEKITVEFTDGDVYEAEVISSDTNADVALIKVKDSFQLKEKNIAKIGDSDKVQIGDNVFIIGAPHGFKQSLSKGIISGKYSPENLSNRFEKVDFFQTDASINPGNSGGPMFNMKGEIVGIASRIYTVSGGFDGIGFAVTSNVANKILANRENWSGFESMVLSPELAALLNLPQQGGILITKVSTQGKAGKLGLMGGFVPVVIAGQELLLGGDIILEIAGVKILDHSSLELVQERLINTKDGEKVSIVILRQGQVVSTTYDK